MDIEDDYSQWNLSIVLENNTNGEVRVHYLPYDNSKRDEWLKDTREDQARIAMAFSKSTYLADNKDDAF